MFGTDIFLFYNFIIFRVMINSGIRQNDILDQAKQNYSRISSGYSPQFGADNNARHDLMLKNMYRQQLDDLMKQKQMQKQIEKQQQSQERKVYNERLDFNKQAERLKDLSYKNYYQMLLSNQHNLTKNYPTLNSERQSQKEHLVREGIEKEKVRSDMQWEAEQKRHGQQKRIYREQLDKNLHQKYLRNSQENESKLQYQQHIKKITYTPHEVAKFQRERKLMEMSKYKEDLQKTSPTISEKSRMVATGNHIIGNGSNDFNIFNESYHNPMVNPIPFNIQNPYILRQFVRKEQMNQNIQNGGMNPNPNLNLAA